MYDVTDLIQIIDQGRLSWMTQKPIALARKTTVALERNTEVTVVHHWPDDGGACSLALARIVDAGTPGLEGAGVLLRLDQLSAEPVEGGNVHEQVSAAVAEARHEAEAKLARDAAGAAQLREQATQEMSGGEPAKAFKSANACLKFNDSDRECQAIVDAARKALANEVPHHIKDFAVYAEGDGYQVYFSLVDAAGRYMHVDGEVNLDFKAVTFDTGFEVLRRTVATYRVSKADFTKATLGRGAFARDALVASTWIKADDIFRQVNSQWGRAAVAQLAQQYGLYIEIRFVDVLHDEHTAQDGLSL